MTKKNKPWYKRLWALLLALAAAAAVYVVTGIIRSEFLESELITLTVPSQSGISGHVRVVQLSDLHSGHFGENNEKLLSLVASKKPDLIVATGDMVDRYAKNLEGCINLFRQLTAIAPTAFSIGNHEYDRGDTQELFSRLAQVGVIPLHGNVETIYCGGIPVRVGGIMRLRELPSLDAAGPIDILLCHYPTDPGYFAARGVSVVFSGHAHGGQARIPLLDIPLYAHGEGLFPHYTDGLYQEDGVSMIVSRGMGNTERFGVRIPRVHNPPEIVVADITFTSPF